METDAATHRTGMVEKKRVDLVNVAKSQRLLLLGLLVAISAYIVILSGTAIPTGGEIVTGIGYVIYLSGLIIVIVGMFKLARAVGSNLFMAIVASIALFIPLLGLLIMALESNRATKALKAAGIKVGLLGVSSEEMKKLVEGVCRQCGYDMRSITTGRCPECGAMAG